METSNSNLHFVLIPWLAPGHMIPMIDIGRLLASRGVLVTVVTTPANATRIRPTIDRISASGLHLRFVSLPFPSAALGLPEGCENLDSIPSQELVTTFTRGARLLKEPLTRHLHEHSPPPSCFIFGMGHIWAHELAGDFPVPRFIFSGFSCFAQLCLENLHKHKTHEEVLSMTEPFEIPAMPRRIEITRCQLPKTLHILPPQYNEILREFRAVELAADGIIVNSFDELETGYAKCLSRASQKSVWMIGPVSLSSMSPSDVAERGNKAAIDERHCLNWLDSKAPKSVVYISFGSMAKFSEQQLMEIGAGLKATNRPFVWVIRSVMSSEIENSLLDEFKCTDCLIIRGWAPQVMIMSHAAVGGFVTHCGWNSIQEGVCAGVPMVTWPLFAEQFFNERLVVEELETGVAIGVNKSMDWGGKEVEKEVVGREAVTKAVERLMGGGEEAEGRRRRAVKLAENASRAVEQGGSSYLNLTKLIQSVAAQAGNKKT